MIRIEVPFPKHSMMCLFCDASLPLEDSRRKFCNRSCAASYNNIKRGAGFKKSQNRKCTMCPAILKYYQNGYCSMVCFNEFRRSRRSERAKEGTLNDPTSLRSHLLHTRSHICVICDGTEWMGVPIPLTVDHINGNPSDDRDENLRLICPNCDRLLPTFGSRNKGFGRKSRGLL